MKQARSEGNKVACLIKANKAEFYIADVDLEDNSDDVKTASETVVKTLGKTRSAFMLISAGVKNITVLVYVPSELSDRIDAEEWLQTSVKNLTPLNQNLTTSEVENKKDGMIVIEADTPFKLKDIVRSNGFKFLNDKGLIKPESDEEFIGFEDF